MFATWWLFFHWQRTKMLHGFFYGQNVCYQVVIERLTKIVAILKVNCDSMIPWEFHPIQRMIYRAPLEFVEKRYLSVH